jgi:hypothetical protein
MGNMSYCRFYNTLQDLLDCQEHLDDAIANPDEARARRRLIQVCREIATDKSNDGEEDES